MGFVTDAGRPEQSVITTTLGRAVEDSEGLKTPTTAIVGQVVSLRPEMMGDSEDTGAAIA